LLFKIQEDEEKAADVRRKLFSKPKCIVFGCVVVEPVL